MITKYDLSIIYIYISTIYIHTYVCMCIIYIYMYTYIYIYVEIESWAYRQPISYSFSHLNTPPAACFADGANVAMRTAVPLTTAVSYRNWNDTRAVPENRRSLMNSEKVSWWFKILWDPSGFQFKTSQLIVYGGWICHRFTQILGCSSSGTVPPFKGSTKPMTHVGLETISWAAQ